MPDIRHDPTTGRWTAIAPARATRPGAVEPAEDTPAACPFCTGHEERTPPESLRLGDGPTGWDVRVVPNLYPALERQEVVIHGPSHTHSIGELAELVEVVALDGVTAGCPVASRVPYEVLIAPAQPEANGLTSELLAPALRLLAELVRRLQAIRGEPLVPLNAWLHDGPHWHLELFPRTTRLAGLELGAGVFVDSVSPEQAARQLGSPL